MAHGASFEEIMKAWREYRAGGIPDSMPAKACFQQPGKLINRTVHSSDVSYSPVETLPGEPWAGALMTINNNSTTEQSTAYEAGSEVATSTTATVERSIELGTEVEVSVGFPKIADVKTKFSLKGTRKWSDTETKSNRVTQKVTFPVKAPAGRKVTAQAYATKKKMTTHWTAQIAVGGVWESEAKGERFIFTIPYIISAAIEKNLVNTTGWRVEPMSYAEQKKLWGTAWPYEGTIFDTNESDLSALLATGEAWGTATYEQFAELTVLVRDIGPADTHGAPGIQTYVANLPDGKLSTEGTLLEAARLDSPQLVLT